MTNIEKKVAEMLQSRGSAISPADRREEIEAGTTSVQMASAQHVRRTPRTLGYAVGIACTVAAIAGVALTVGGQSDNNTTVATNPTTTNDSIPASSIEPFSSSTTILAAPGSTQEVVTPTTISDATDLFDHRATIEGLGLEVVELGDRVEDGVAAIIGGEPHILVGLSTGEPAFVSLRSFEAPIELCGSTPEPPGCDGIEPLLESAEGHRGHPVVNERAEPIGVLGISFQGVVPTRAFEATGAVDCYEEALRATRVDNERRTFIAEGRGSCLSQMFDLIF